MRYEVGLELRSVEQGPTIDGVEEVRLVTDDGVIADEVLPASCSHDLYRRAGEPKDMTLYPECRHGLAASRWIATCSAGFAAGCVRRSKQARHRGRIAIDPGIA